MSRGSNPAKLCCSSTHLVRCEPDEPGGFTGPNMSPGKYARLRLKLDARFSAIQGVPKKQKSSSPTRSSLVETRSLKGIKSAIVPLWSPKGLLRASGDLLISRRRNLVYIKGTNSTLPRHVNRKFFYKKWT